MRTVRTNVDLGLLLLRLALGIVFVMHGGQKLAMGPTTVAGFLSTLGFPFPVLNAWLLIAVELGGGLALLAGFLARPAGVLLAVNMLIAMTTVHLRNGFFLPNGYEFTLTLILANLAVAAAGAGAYSLDAWLSRARPVTEVRAPAVKRAA